MPIDASCYNMQGRCDGDNHAVVRRFSFNGNSYAEAMLEFRSEGWTLDRKTGVTLCPKCSKKETPRG